MPTEMQPKCSALLNNCLLHSLTPEIKEEIQKFAAEPKYDNKHNEAYNQLKNCFADFYKLDKESFDWKLFSDTLNRYNPFDLQLLLGPVLRKFSAEQMESELRAAQQKSTLPRFNSIATSEAQHDKQLPDDEQLYKNCNDIPRRYIQIHSTINPRTARYSSLDQFHAVDYICNPLGLKLTCTKDGNAVTLGNESSTVGTILIVHQGDTRGAAHGGHWERTDNKSMMENFEEYENSQLKVFKPLLEEAQTYEIAFYLIQQHLQYTVQSILKRSDLSELFKDLNNTPSQIEHYLISTQLVSPGFAQTLLNRPITPMAQEFISRFKPSEKIYPGNQYEQYITALRNKSAYIPYLPDGHLPTVQRLLKFCSSIQPSTATKPSTGLFTPLQTIARKLVLPQQTQPHINKPKPLAQQPKQEEEQAQQQAEQLAKQKEEQAKQQAERRSSNPFWIEFNEQIKILEAKINEFKDKDTEYHHLHAPLNQLCVQLKKEGERYFGSSPTRKSFEEFRRATDELINNDSAAINQHRHFTQVCLVNLAAFLLTAGVGYLIAAGIDFAIHKRFTFFNTQRADEIEHLQDIIKHSGPTK